MSKNLVKFFLPESVSKAHNCHEKGERGEERDCGDDDDDAAVGMKSRRGAVLLPITFCGDE